MAKLGKVYLVGAGPGDPGLLTLKGLDCLQRADLILYDGLVNRLLLRHTSAKAERTCRSPGPFGLRLDQEQVNARLISAAREGKTVVRLKGGDPFIFGRGSEEALALVDAGIPFEVVPGVTAATAASEYAGISLTHRGISSIVTFITGHEDPEKDVSPVDYNLLAQLSGTLVFYMGLHRLDFISASLIQAGKDAATPSAVISRGTTTAQKVVVAPLGELPQMARQAGLRPPSLIVVGECVRLQQSIAWFEKLPLFGTRIGITRPSGQAEPVVRRVLEWGGQPVLIPAIEILPPDDWSMVDSTLGRLAGFDWLAFTSSNGVEQLLTRLWQLGHDVRSLAGLKIAAIGESTADALARFHLKADVVPEEFRAEALADALKPHVAGKRVLWARACRGRDVLPAELKAAGAFVEELVVYRNVDVDGLPESELSMIENGQLHWIGLSSPSIARSLRHLLSPTAMSQLGRAVRLASISPVTSAAAAEVGLPIAAEATVYTWDGILDAIVAAERGAAERAKQGDQE